MSKNERQWPISKINLSNIDTPEIRVVLTVSTARAELPIFTRFSSFSKLQRVFAWALRFISNCKNINNRNIEAFLTSEELKEANYKIMRLIQKNEFVEELKILGENKVLSKKSRLLALSPFVDQTGLIP